MCASVGWVRAYGSGGEVVLELVDDMQQRMAEFMKFVAETLGVGYISLVVHLLTHGPEICRKLQEIPRNSCSSCMIEFPVEWFQIVL